jgi:hypothetical protein
LSANGDNNTQECKDQTGCSSLLILQGPWNRTACVLEEGARFAHPEAKRGLAHGSHRSACGGLANVGHRLVIHPSTTTTHTSFRHPRILQEMGGRSSELAKYSSTDHRDKEVPGTDGRRTGSSSFGWSPAKLPEEPFLLQYSVFGPCRSPFAEMQEEGSNYPPRHEYSYISGILDNYISWGLSMRFSLLPHSLNVPGTSILTRLLYEYTYSYILEMSGSQPRIAKSPLNCNPGRRSLRFWKLGDDGRRISHHQLRGEHSLGGIGPWPLGGME